MEIINISGYT